MAKNEMSPGCMVVGGLLFIAPLLFMIEDLGAGQTLFGLSILGGIYWFSQRKNN